MIDPPLDDGLIQCHFCGVYKVDAQDYLRHIRKHHITIVAEMGQTATTDDRGRISLGAEYANETVEYDFRVIEDE
jgi:hypothetical protein